METAKGENRNLPASPGSTNCWEKGSFTSFKSCCSRASGRGGALRDGLIKIFFQKQLEMEPDSSGHLPNASPQPPQEGRSHAALCVRGQLGRGRRSSEPSGCTLEPVGPSHIQKPKAVSPSDLEGSLVRAQGTSASRRRAPYDAGSLVQSSGSPLLEFWIRLVMGPHKLKREALPWPCGHQTARLVSA